jgi:ribA/ribD-fused uncharacterized protein
MAIDLFKGKYEFLSNFYVFQEPIHDDMRLTYLTVENAYQAHKTLDRDERLRIRRLPPNKAKIEGQKIALRSDWEEIKRLVMLNFVTQKFLYNAELRQRLIATRGQDLIEGNYWHDYYWGVCAGRGENHLGKILMGVRKMLPEEETP